MLVTLHNATTFGGVLWEADSKPTGSLVLRDAEALPSDPQARATPVDGELVIPWSNVAFIQKP